MSSKLSDTYTILISVRLLYFAISAIKREIVYEVTRCTPSTVDRTYPKHIWCICLTDPSETAIKYPSSSWVLSTSSIVASILLYCCLSGANWTNLKRSRIHVGCSTSNCWNDFNGSTTNSSSILSSAPNSLYTSPVADVLIKIGIMCFVGWYFWIVSIHVSCVLLLILWQIIHS